MTELTAEAKELIAKEFDELSRKAAKTLQELAVYRWALRIFLAVFLGGTIFGVLRFQDYLDDRIQKRTEELSGIVYGSVAQSSFDPRTAIEQYNDFLPKLETAALRPSEPIRSIFYLRFIQALADDVELDPSGEFEVRPAFLALTESRYFKKDFLLNERRWRDDPVYLNSWGRCLVKFGASDNDIGAANRSFERAASVSDRPSAVASNQFAMAMIALARGREDDAKSLFQKAMEASPRSHGVNSFVGDYRSDFEGEYQVWERCARVLNSPGIADRYARVMRTLIAEHRAKGTRTATR
jgi:tetratricopeptide (TPR) repeat protein